MYRAGGKRMMDIAASLLVLLALAPLLLAVAIGVKLSSPGPAIFRQQRVGKDGRPFEIYKFRSMPTGTGDVASDAIGKTTITAFGQFIRRTNLDELPQLFNILKGDMSLVGPRPPLASQQDLVDLRAANGALGCRPGLTGLAQVNSFDGMSVAEKAAFDGRYATRITLASDTAIIFRTIGYLMRPPPVY